MTIAAGHFAIDDGWILRIYDIQMAPAGNSEQSLQTTGAVSSVEYFREIYSSRESAWGEAASDLAREAVALVKLHLADTPIRVLDIGCGDGRDSILFAKQGWQDSCRFGWWRQW